MLYQNADFVSEGSTDLSYQFPGMGATPCQSM